MTAKTINITKWLEAGLSPTSAREAFKKVWAIEDKAGRRGLVSSDRYHLRVVWDTDDTTTPISKDHQNAYTLYTSSLPVASMRLYAGDLVKAAGRGLVFSRTEGNSGWLMYHKENAALIVAGRSRELGDVETAVDCTVTENFNINISLRYIKNVAQGFAPDETVLLTIYDNGVILSNDNLTAVIANMNADKQPVPYTTSIQHHLDYVEDAKAERTARRYRPARSTGKVKPNRETQEVGFVVEKGEEKRVRRNKSEADTVLTIVAGEHVNITRYATPQPTVVWRENCGRITLIVQYHETEEGYQAAAVEYGESHKSLLDHAYPTIAIARGLAYYRFVEC